MARKCPKCERPNNDRAEHCLYCGAHMPAAPPPAPARKPEQEKKAAPEERPAPKKPPPPPEVYLVMVSPCQELRPESLESFCKIMGMDNYTARHKLSGPAPWMARAFPEAQPAQSMAQAFSSMGLDAYVIKQSGIDKIAKRVQAAGVQEIGDSEMVLLDGKGSQVPLPFEDIMLIVRGRIRERPERAEDMEDETPSVRVGKMLAGEGDQEGIRGRISRLGWKPRPALMRWVMRGQSIEIMDIYRKSTPRSIRVVETEFDYSGMGQDMKHSSLLNFNFMLNRIRENAPRVYVDQTFNAVGYTMSDVPREDKVRIQLEAVLGASESARKIYDNRALFDQFSATTYLHHLRRSATGKG